MYAIRGIEMKFQDRKTSSYSPVDKIAKKQSERVRFC